MLKSFTGFRGVAALCSVGDIKFVIVATNVEQLEILYAGLLKESSDPFNPSACKPSVVISSKLLPQRADLKDESKTSHDTETTDKSSEPQERQ